MNRTDPPVIPSDIETSQITGKTAEFFLQEYSALRQEILKRMEIQHQLVTLTLTAFGVLTTVGLNSDPNALLAYPILTVFLTAAWSQNDIRIGQIGYYIREAIEEKFLATSLGWEHRHITSRQGLLVGARAILAAQGIFIGTQLMALLLATLKMLPHPTLLNLILLGLDILVLLATIFLFTEYQSTRKSVANSPTT